MNDWYFNYAGQTAQKPPQNKGVEVLLQNGEVKKASWLKDINKYVRNVNRWRIIDTGKYVDDIEVKEWREYDSNSVTACDKEEQPENRSK